MKTLIELRIYAFLILAFLISSIFFVIGIMYNRICLLRSILMPDDNGMSQQLSLQVYYFTMKRYIAGCKTEQQLINCSGHIDMVVNHRFYNEFDEKTISICKASLDRLIHDKLLQLDKKLRTVS